MGRQEEEETGPTELRVLSRLKGDHTRSGVGRADRPPPERAWCFWDRFVGGGRWGIFALCAIEYDDDGEDAKTADEAEDDGEDSDTLSCG